MALTIKTAGFEEYLNAASGAWIKCLILGEHGVGKTPSAARWPDPIIADCEHGVMSVAALGTPYASIESSKDMEELIDYLRRDSMLPAEKRKYRTLIIDTVDSYQRTLVTERLKAERKESLSGWADWGWLAGKGGWLIEKLLNLPINVVVNMHVKDKRDDDGESTMLIKDNTLKGDLGETIYRDFDLIGLMEKSYTTVDGERVLTRQIRWHSEPKFPMLRDRSNKLPRFTDIDFTEGDYQRIFDLITAGVDDLPASQDLEEIGEPEPDVEVVGPTAGGPVTNVKPIRPPVAKKAPAKKAAAKAVKGAHATLRDDDPAEVKVEEEGTPVDIPPVVESNSAESDDKNAKADADAQALVEKELGGEVVDEEAEKTEAEAKVEKAREVLKEAEATAKEKLAAPPATGTNPKCGDVSPGMAGDPSLGCGTELSAKNAMKRQMAQLRTKTNLCDDCFEKWKASH